MDTFDDTPGVRGQYEALPYPSRDPADEDRRLVRTWLDDLPMINHYGFGGRQAFGDGFRALVAGGGTGDATIFLAEQLRGRGAQIVHLDFSAASIAIAQARAARRGLAGIRFVQASLLDLPTLGLDVFDYINCVGVLHHLADPDAGLAALLAVLAPGGTLGIMVYAACGRTGVYQMQQLLREVNAGETDMQARLANARDLLAAAPATNWFKRGEDQLTDHLNGDAGLYDLLLHGRDRAYSVDELFDWFEGTHGLHLSLTDVQRGRSSYLPALRMGAVPPPVLAAILRQPLRRQYAIAELFTGRIQTHSFYATRHAGAAAAYADPDAIPFFFHEPVTGPEVAAIFARCIGRPTLIDHAWSGVSVTLPPSRYAAAILQHIDGRTPFRKIFSLVRRDPAFRTAAPRDEAMFEDFRPVYECFNAIDRLLLRFA